MMNERVSEKRRSNPPNPLNKGAKIRILVPLLGALSCRFFIRGFPPKKNAANPSGNPTNAHPLFKGDVGGLTTYDPIQLNFSHTL
jgi:hypothetical protein